LNASDLQCIRPKINCPSVFSSSRAFQRYIVCKFSSPIALSPIFILLFYLGIESTEETCSRRGRSSFFSLGPTVSERDRGEREYGSGELGTSQLDPHVTINEAQQQCTTLMSIFTYSKALSLQRQIQKMFLIVSNLHTEHPWSPSCTLKDH
jgi:hypothetical protein